MQKITKRANGSTRVQEHNDEKSLTKQSFADECDVNNIMKKYLKTGEITHLARKQGVYVDVSKITDYQSSLNTIMAAENAFGTLPSHLRERFNNDPEQMLAFLGDPKNHDEGVTLGLFEPKPQIPQTQNLPGPKNEPNSNKTTNPPGKNSTPSKNSPPAHTEE